MTDRDSTPRARLTRMETLLNNLAVEAYALRKDKRITYPLAEQSRQWSADIGAMTVQVRDLLIATHPPFNEEKHD